MNMNVTRHVQYECQPGMYLRFCRNVHCELNTLETGLSRDVKQIDILCANNQDDAKTKKYNDLPCFHLRSPDSTSSQIHARTAVVLSAAHHPVLCAPPPSIILFMPKSSSPFYQNPLVPILLLPFIANPPSKKHRRENERQKMEESKISPRRRAH